MSDPIQAPEGCQFTLRPAGDAWLWRMTTPEGATLDGLAPNQITARRSAAFAAYAATSLSRARGRTV